MFLNRARRTRIGGRLLVGAIVGTLVVPAVAAAPQPLTAVEIAATRLASLYLDQGAEAWWPELAPDSELAELGRESSVAEIEARAGDPEGSRWTLQLAEAAADDPHRAVFTVSFPSGVEEILFLTFEPHDDGFLLRRLHTSAEPGPARRSASAAEPAPAVDPAPPTEPAAASPGTPTSPGLEVIAAAAAGGVLCLLALAFRRRKPLAVVAASAAVVCFGWAIAARLGPGSETPAPPAAPPTDAATNRPAAGFVRLGDLVELRRALGKPDPGAVAAEIAKLDTKTPAGRIGRLWHGQYLLAEQELAAVEELLEDYPSTQPVQQAELLRARLGFLRFEEVATAAAFERAIEVAGGYDDLIFEAAQVLEFMGFDERTDALYGQLEEMGSRNPELYYRLAGRSLVEGWNARASQYFTEAWRLNPLERHEVLSRPLLAALTQDFSVRSLLRMSDVAEPGVVCATAGEPPFELPASASTRVIGSLFVAEFLDGEMWVPNGCELASPSTAAFDPVAWRKRSDTLALAELPTLMTNAETRSVVALPRLRDRVAEAAEALARRRRWDELLALTAGVADNLPKVPARLARLRARALKEAGRADEARELLTRLAALNIKKRRPDPGTLLQLADLMVTDGEYDVAVRLIEKADAAIPADIGYDRIQKIYMEKQLASAYAEHSTENFEIRYPARRNPYLAERIGEILEAERRRLTRWIPAAGGKIDVHLLPWSDFRTAWSTSVEILGLYDGKIRLPFADVPRFSPPVVSILTHELAHAMIDRYTRSNAPHWLHEGLAQHVQMIQGRINPIEGYSAKQNLLAFPLIESVLLSFASPALIGIAYDEALWTLHYIETVHGRRAVRRLLDAFRDGMNTEEAIEASFDMSLAEFDRDLWHWCLNRAPAAWKAEIVRYDRG